MLRTRYSWLAIFMALCLIMPLTGCNGDDKDDLETDRLSSAEVKYTFTVTEDLLKYFNITAIYINADGREVSRQITEFSTQIATSAYEFPAQRPIHFAVSRIDVPAPTASPNWQTSLTIMVNKQYYPSNTVQQTVQSDSQVYSPKPEKFDTWANTFIKQMATEHTVTIYSDGKVTF